MTKKIPTAKQELGDFLRSRRNRLSAESCGLQVGRHRRTTGLRREEVAQFAGIGVDWYSRLEQGRALHPSNATVDALARVLRLDTAEHAHLRSLAGSSQTVPFTPEVVPATLRRIVTRLREPAYVVGRRWDLLVWNQAAADLFIDFRTMPKAERNILVYVLTYPQARTLFGSSWLDEAKRMTALFRTTYDVWATDRAFVQLKNLLHDRCPEFKEWWEEHHVSSPKSGRKVLQHPTLGLLRAEYSTFQANDDASLKLALYSLES